MYSGSGSWSFDQTQIRDPCPLSPAEMLGLNPVSLELRNHFLRGARSQENQI